MPPVGVEPTLSCENWILSPARLPIPPQRQFSGQSLSDKKSVGHCWQGIILRRYDLNVNRKNKFFIQKAGKRKEGNSKTMLLNSTRISHAIFLFFLLPDKKFFALERSPTL